MLPPPGFRHRSFWVTGSQATSMPRWPSGGVGPMAGNVFAGFAGCTGCPPRLSAAAAPAPAAPPRLPRSKPVFERPFTYVKFGSTVYVPLLVVDVGIYTKPV